MKNNGTPLWKLLLVLFIALKLTGFINWTWFWVLSPAWIMAAGALILAILGTIAKEEE